MAFPRHGPEGNANPVEEVFHGFMGARLERDGVADVPDRPYGYRPV